MREPDSASSLLQSQDRPTPISRRQLLGSVVSAPIVPAGLGLATLPSTAQAAPLPLTPPDPVDAVDAADLLLFYIAPTMMAVKSPCDPSPAALNVRSAGSS